MFDSNMAKEINQLVQCYYALGYNYGIQGVLGHYDDIDVFHDANDLKNVTERNTGQIEDVLTMVAKTQLERVNTLLAATYPDKCYKILCLDDPLYWDNADQLSDLITIDYGSFMTYSEALSLAKENSKKPYVFVRNTDYGEMTTEPTEDERGDLYEITGECALWPLVVPLDAHCFGMGVDPEASNLMRGECLEK